MNPNYSRDQFSDFENFQPTYTNVTSQPSPGQVEDSIVNFPYTNFAQTHSIHSPNQYFDSPTIYTMDVQSLQPHQTLQSTSANMTVPLQATHPITFSCQPPNNFCSCYVTTREISLAKATQLLNESNENINFHQNK